MNPDDGPIGRGDDTGRIETFSDGVFVIAITLLAFDEERAATVLYAGTLAVTAVFFTLLWLYAASGHRLVERDVDPHLLRAMTQRYVIGVLLYTVAFALAFVSVIASLALIWPSPCSSYCRNRANAGVPRSTLRVVAHLQGSNLLEGRTRARSASSSAGVCSLLCERTSRRRGVGSGRGSWPGVSGARS